MSNQIVELTGVTKTYRASAQSPETRVLTGVDLTIESGEAVAIVGASGSGKSTLLNIIGALDEPTSGSVKVGGEILAGRSEEMLAAFRANQVGMIFQLHHLLPQCTALENILMPSLSHRDLGRREQVSERANRLLKRVGLQDRRNHFPSQLSGGERQRVAVVRALINEPKILLADEPTGALDQQSAESLTQLLLELNRDEGVALLVITHSVELANRMGRVLELREGKLDPLAS